ncbi:MAG: SprT family zinc-dependent metalloprotease [Desulfotomaculaceae bacterium]|nr:SprT family zinc-dependent metalloprotease [Desulfotomaculaceae bacterium]MDD4766726.1 SprT family zinc-dependent metalloprotease [Desulfotomaculaceae bacterium]
MNIKLQRAAKKTSVDERLPRGTVSLAGRKVVYSLKTSARAKNLRLKVDLENGLVITVPECFDSGTLDTFLRKKQGWILDKLDYFAQLKQSSLVGKQPGWYVLYRGREYRVEVRTGGITAGAVVVEDDRIVVMLNEGSGKDAAVVLECWMKSMARLLINQRISVVNNVLKLSFNRVAIRGQKTRWGSCSNLGNLNFNWRLVMAPLQVLDYIVTHELLHLVEPNHSKKFWDMVENVCPDYKACRDWLKKNGHRLKIF